MSEPDPRISSPCATTPRSARYGDKLDRLRERLQAADALASPPSPSR